MKKSLFKEFIKYSSLSVLGMVGLSCYILADTFFVSKSLGADGLTALNIAIPVYNFISGTGLMLGMGGAIKYAVCKAQERRKDGDRVFTGVMLFAAFFSAFFVLLGVFFSGQISSLLGAEGRVLPMTQTYMRVMLLFAPAFIFNQVFICFIRNDSAPRLSMAGMITGSLSNIVLDYVFIFPLDMGIFGAVLATGFSPLISMAVMSVHLIKKRNGFHLIRTKPDIKILVSTVKLGFPSLVTELSSGIVIIVFNMLILRLAGNNGVAAYGVIANISLVAVAVFNGIAQGGQPLMSAAFGKGRYADSKRLLIFASVSALILSAVFYSLLYLFDSQIVGIFNSEGNAFLQQTAEKGVKLYFTALPFAGVNIVFSIFFASVEKALPAHTISILRGLAAIIPIAVVMSFAFGMTGVWTAFPVTEAAVCAVSLILYIYYNVSFKKA